MNKNNKTILLVGGGTGGHAAPILAIYKKIKSINPELKIAVTGNGSEEEKVFFDLIPDYYKIRSGKLNRFFTLKNISGVFNFFLGFCQSLFLLRELRPNLIFSKGGFASLPVVLAASLLKIPYFLHESDIEMGKTNKIMARRAKKVFVCYPTNFYSELKSSRLIFSGPVLREGFDRSQRNAEEFTFKNHDPIIFLTGGSQGSLNLSNNLMKIAPYLLGKFNIIHQAGKHSYGNAREFKGSLDKALQEKYYLCSFLGIEKGKDKMLEAINSADLIISRAGSTITELAILGKPMLLVPWKDSAQGHQLKNAEFLQGKDAAVVIKEEELNPEILKEKIKEIFSNSGEKLHQLSTSAREIFPKNGCELISNNILKEIL